MPIDDTLKQTYSSHKLGPSLVFLISFILIKPGKGRVSLSSCFDTFLVASLKQ